MIRSEYNTIETKIGRWSQKEVKTVIDVIPNVGKQKGKLGVIVANEGGTLVVMFDNDPIFTRKYTYTALALVDENGNAVGDVVCDMTGRELHVGNIICYSVSAGQNSHACGLGKVKAITKSGLITVDPFVRNGEIINKDQFYYRCPRALTPNRTLLLPVTETLTMMWQLSDFTRLNGEV